jgi:hypothetical protein
LTVKVEGGTQALVTQRVQKGRKDRPKGKDGHPIKGNDPNAYCEECKCYEHSISKCVTLFLRNADAPAKPAKMNIAVATPLVADGDDSDGESVRSVIMLTAVVSAHVAISPKKNPSLVADTGASEHLVYDVTLLVNVRPAETIKILVGNGGVLYSSTTGDLRVGNILFRGAYHAGHLAQPHLCPEARG